MKFEQSMVDRVENWLEEHRGAFIQDLSDLVNIKSVTQKTSGPHPFGEGCAHVLDAALEKAKGYGFEVDNVDYYCGTAAIPGGAQEVGMIAHLDVVPEGNDWTREPYQAVYEDGFLYGRGSGDDKGPAMAGLYAMRCIKELGLEAKHTVRLIFGCNEEAGMEDVEYYMSHRKAPDFAFTPDCEFPICNAEKGIYSADLISRNVCSQIVDFKGGLVSNAVPDLASVVLRGVDIGWIKDTLPSTFVLTGGENVTITAKGKAAHAAKPEGSVNAIGILADYLAQNEIVTGDDLENVKFLAHLLSDVHGAALNVAFEDDISGKLTHVGGFIRMQEGRLAQNINIRYPVTADRSLLCANISGECGRWGYDVKVLEDSAPCHTSEDKPTIQMLMRAYEAATGEKAYTYSMGGGTYARHLPSAVGFGPGVHGFSRPGSPSRGGAHQADECQSIDLLLKAAKIYVLSLVALGQVTL